eukprot:scaffold39627_cov303-Isochrysis_galbana.AAC.1
MCGKVASGRYSVAQLVMSILCPCVGVTGWGGQHRAETGSRAGHGCAARRMLGGGGRLHHLCVGVVLGVVVHLLRVVVKHSSADEVQHRIGAAGILQQGLFNQFLYEVV